MSSRAQQISRNMEIPGRKMHFEFDLKQLPRYWYDNNAFKSTYMNALSCLFPEGERMFIDAVRDNKDKVSDPKLLEQIKGFIKQEAIHGHEHHLFNEYLDSMGYPASKIEAFEKKEKRLMRKWVPAIDRLALTCAVEHFTAIMAHDLLQHPERSDGVDENFKQLWRWHAIEETEHKAVAFDVYLAVGGGYLRRMLAMVVVTIMFCLRASIVQGIFLWKDGKLFSPSTWIDGFKFYFGKDGLTRSIFKNYLDYYRTDFHPWDHDNREYLESWIEEAQSYKAV
ncbi:MAG: metal-dependent hydrolase [Saccharospirillaceae bacterium]|nr:hypothetical protein A3759_10465 [Thalassolituus sp. HI0120]MCH2041901.1 metal-dependent hydrolase [Saccharospirillaceae bacterium]